MPRLRISDAPLLNSVIGNEKIPTGKYGDYTLTPDMIVGYAQGKLPFATKTELAQVKAQLEANINTVQTTLSAEIATLSMKVDSMESQILGVSQDLTLHKADVNNPHKVTKSQVGLSDVDNTSDLNKPISTATQAALNQKISSVNGKTGNAVVLTREDIGFPTDDQIKAFSKEAKYVLDESGLTQQNINNNLLGSDGSSFINTHFNDVQNSIERDTHNVFYNQIIDVSWFGAKGDWNKTTQTGTDDTVAVQNAINYLASLPTRREAGKRGLKFPKGSYRLSSITLPASLGFGLDILGDGVKTTNLYFDHTSTNPAITCEIEFTQFKDITLIGSLDETWVRPRTVGFLGKLPNNYPDIDVTFFNCEIVAWDTFAQIHGRGCIFESCMVGIIIRLMEIVCSNSIVHGADSDNMQSKYATMRHYVIRNTRFDNVSRVYTVSGSGLMLDYINTLIFVGNDLTNADILIDAPLASVCNSTIIGNTAIGSFLTRVFNVKTFKNVNIVANNFRKQTSVDAQTSSAVTATEYLIDATQPFINLNVSNNIVKGISKAFIRNTSTQSSSNVIVTNNILDEFGVYKGGNSAISFLLLTSNCKRLTISNNSFNATTTSGSYYLFNILGNQLSIDVEYHNNLSPFQFSDRLFSFTPKVFIGSNQTTGVTNTAYAQYKCENGYAVGKLFVGGTIPEASGSIFIDLPVPAIAEIVAYSSAYSGFSTISNNVGVSSVGYVISKATVNASSQRIELKKEKDMISEPISAADVPSNYSMVIDFKYRVK